MRRTDRDAMNAPSKAAAPRGSIASQRHPLLLIVLLAATGFLAIFDNVITLSSLPFLRNPAAIVAAALVALYVWYRRKGLPLYTGAFRWVLAFLIYTAVLELLRGVWTGGPEVLRYAQWFQALVLTVVSIDLVRDRRGFSLVWGGVVAAAVFMALSTILSLPGFTGVADGRTGFVGVNLNRQGHWYAMGIATLLWLLLRRWPRFGWSGVGLLASLGTLGYAMIQTGSRGALVSMVIGSAIVLVLSLRARNVSAYATIVPLLFLLGAWYLADASILRDRVADTLSGEDLGSRDVIALQAIEMVAERPLFGYGPGFVEALGEARGMDRPLSSHNTFLQTGLTFGLPGLALWMAIMVSAWIRAWRSWFGYGHPIGALLLALVTMSMAFGLVSDLAFNKYFWTLIALASQAPLTATRTSETSERIDAASRRPARVVELGPSG